jgi:hypothetical protein
LSLESSDREAPVVEGQTSYKRFSDGDFRLVEDDIEFQKKYIKNLEVELKAAKDSLKVKQRRLKVIEKKWAPENREKLIKKLQKEFSK